MSRLLHTAGGTAPASHSLRLHDKPRVCLRYKSVPALRQRDVGPVGARYEAFLHADIGPFMRSARKTATKLKCYQYLAGPEKSSVDFVDLAVGRSTCN